MPDLANALTGVWRTCADAGQRVHACTITPVDTSGTFTTTAGQTAGAHNATRAAVNDWIRAGAPINSTTLAYVPVGTVGALTAGQPGHPLIDWFETADTVETARNSGIWKANYTEDGTHPSSVGHAAMAAAIDTTRFVPQLVAGAS